MRFGALQRTLEPLFEFGTIDQMRQRVVTGVEAQPIVQFACLADVVEYQNATGYRTRRVTNRRCRSLYLGFVAVTLDQKRRPHGIDRPISTHGDTDRVLDRLTRLLVEPTKNFID